MGAFVVDGLHISYQTYNTVLVQSMDSFISISLLTGKYKLI